MKRTLAACVALALAWSGAASAESHAAKAPDAEMIRAATAGIDGAAIIANMAETKNWLNYGLGYDEARFSKLTGLTTDNVGDLGLAWSHNMNSRRGVEATPIVDGTLGTATALTVTEGSLFHNGEGVLPVDDCECQATRNNQRPTWRNGLSGLPGVQDTTYR